MFRLDGKVAVITGAGGLLGRHHALALNRHGANVVLTDVNPSLCEPTRRALDEEGGPESLMLACDVANRESWHAMIRDVLKHFGKVDVLVNNAAYTNQSQSAGYGASFLETALSDWSAIIEVNLTGAFLGCQIVGEVMLAAGRGSIVNIASLYAMVSPNHRIYPGTGIHQPAAYSVSKAGVLALTRYLATLWADRGVRVNAITPGGVFAGHTAPFKQRYEELNPMKRMAHPWEMSGALVYLASDASSYCVGHNLVVDGGWTAW